MTLPYSFTHTAFHHTHCRHLARESVCREAASFKRACGKEVRMTRIPGIRSLDGTYPKLRMGGDSLGQHAFLLGKSCRRLLPPQSNSLGWFRPSLPYHSARCLKILLRRNGGAGGQRCNVDV